MQVNTEEKFEEYPYIEDCRGSYLWLILIIAAILLFFIIAGITYSLYDNTISGTKQPIFSNLLFNYTDVDGKGNGIFIQNAKEMSDITGKKLMGEGNVFEFTVSGNTKHTPISYSIVLEADKASTISDSDIKVYLAKVDGSVETELTPEVPVYSSLEDIQVEGASYKKLYSVSLDSSVHEFSQDYILRMWVREGSSDYYGKHYSLKVNVLAEGVGE